jgi:hypothetical protein
MVTLTNIAVIGMPSNDIFVSIQQVSKKEQEIIFPLDRLGVGGRENAFL